MTRETIPAILVVTSDPTIAKQLADILHTAPMSWYSAQNADEASTILKSETVDLVICDESLYQTSREILVQDTRRQSPPSEIILLCYEREKADLKSSAGSILDRLSLPLCTAETKTKIAQALERRRLRHEIFTLRTHVAMSFGFDNIIGDSKAMRTTKETAARIAPTDISILITGPSGSGKELLARTIHQHSERRAGRFVAIDCSATSAESIETDLFGTAQTADTSAGTTYQPLCLLADGGTLFLDEVGSLSPSTQTRLLKFLSDSTLQSGTSSAPRKVDLRIIATSSTYLPALVAEGTFREELFFKLAVLTIALPSLADRTEDIPMLADYLLRRFSRETMRSDLCLTPLALEKLQSHRWPGNVRELENTLRRAATLCSGQELDSSHISFVTSGNDTSSAEATSEGRHSLTISGGLLVHHQREVIVKALDDHRWNFTRTAAALGIGRTTLWRKVKKYNLVPGAGVTIED